MGLNLTISIPLGFALCGYAFPLFAADSVPPIVVQVIMSPQSGSVVKTAPTAITIICSESIKSSSVTAASVQIIGSGGDGTFGDGNETMQIPTGIVVTGSNINLNVSGLTFSEDRYRIRLAAGKSGKALYFAGDGDLVTMPNTASLNPTTGLTLETWFRFEIGGNFNPRLIERDLYNIGTTGTGSPRTIGVGYGLESSTTYAAGTWHHAALTIDGVSTRWNLYVDGVLVSTITGVSLTGSSIPLLLGRSRSSGYDQYQGYLDEVRVWERVRSHAEIQATMALPLSGSELGLVGYWRMDEASGQTVFDTTGYGNDAVLGADSVVASDDPTRATSDVPLSGIQDLAGNVLDGELSGGDLTALPSGDGSPGGDFLGEFVLDLTKPALSTLMITLTGSVSTEVTGLTVDGNPVAFDGNGNWTSTITVPVGSTGVTITSTVSGGGSTSRFVAFTLPSGG